MTKPADTIKYYTRRDSATSVLRKMGVPSDYYVQLIEVMSDGQYELNVTKAEAFLESLKKPKVAPAKAGRRVDDPIVEKTGQPKRGSISHVARELILSGKTNLEVWVLLKETFGLDESKRHYPTWYRAELKRKGLMA